MRKTRRIPPKQTPAISTNLKPKRFRELRTSHGRFLQILIVLAVASFGYAALMITHAATTTATTQAESGSRSSNVSLITDGSASGGKAVQFHAASSGGGGGTGGGGGGSTGGGSGGGGGTALSLNGTSLSQGGKRFIFKGVNLEYFRDSGGASISTSEVSMASQLVAKMKAAGINAVRLDYTPSFVNQGSNMSSYENMMKLLASNGMYILPCDHSYTNGTISGYTTTSFPDFKTILDYAKQQGIMNYIVMNPYNESNGSESSWVSAYKATLQYFRSTLGYKGIVAIDTNSWATTDNTSSFQTIQSYDASLMGGKANVMFSNHLYPGYDYQTNMSLSKTYPMMFGELGNTVSGGYSSSGENYVNQVFSAEISTGIPDGNNGIFPWIWWWTDGNQMTDDGLTLNSVGQQTVTNYYSKVSN